jgi:proteasome lid subunit RPN8/RPN11
MLAACKMPHPSITPDTIMTNLFPAASVAAMAHAETEYPRESVGIITGEGEYVPLVNTHPDAANFFEISDEDLTDHADDVACVIHSHCYARGEVDPAFIGPSKADQEARLQWGCPWGLIPCIERIAEEPIFWGEFRLNEPLIQRRFIPQVTDCYELIRAAYWQWYAIRLPEYPRDWDWWKRGENLYEEGFAAAGFRPLDDLNDHAPGDVLLARADEEAHVVNHAALVLDGGRILHHRPGRLSERISAGVWQRGNFFTRALRHTAFGDGKPPPPREDKSIF